MPPLLVHLAQIVAAAFGGLAFQWLGIPAAWLSGSLVGVVVWRAFGPARPIPNPLAELAMLISGATMGAAITPEALVAVARYPLSLAALVVAVVAVCLASSTWLIWGAGWRRDDAVLASVPGALSTVLLVAVDRKANVASIAVVQTFRLLILMTILPSAVAFLGGGRVGNFATAGQPLATPEGLAAVLLGGLALGILFRRLRIAAPILFGTAVVSTTLHVTGIAPGVIPPAIATMGLVLIGLYIAESFRTLRWASIRELIPAALGSFALGMAVACVFAGASAFLARVPMADALVAFAPGGLEAMMILAVVLGLDPLYVGIHHLARLLGIGFSIPFVVTWLQRIDPPLPDPAVRGGPDR
jgi:membrane AbrB-like protein